MKMLPLLLFITILLRNNAHSSSPLDSGRFSLANVAHHLVRTCQLESNFSTQKNEFKRMKSHRIKVGVVGAGISGLYASILLQDLGIKYEIVEASNRIGGRFHTYYFDKLSKYNYVELGAMRFPRIPEYDRLIGKQNWSLISYLNANVNSNYKLNLIPFVMEHPNNVFHFNKKTRLGSEVESHGDLFGFGKNQGGLIDEKYTVKNALFWDQKAIDFIKHQFDGNQSAGYDFLIKNDYKTFRSFLMDPSNSEFAYPSDVVDWIENFSGQTGKYSFSFMDGYLINRFYVKEMTTIDGGVLKLISAMNSLLKHKPKLRTVVKRVKQIANQDLLVETSRGQFKYSHLILTPLLPVLRDIDFDLDMNLKKRIAIRTAGNAMAMKISIKFHTRFWENAKLMNDKPIFGGSSVTDLRIREIVYPSYGINCTSCAGTLLVSYIQFREAGKFLSLTNKEAINICLNDLSAIHGPIVFKQFSGQYKVMHWSRYKWTQGAYTSFEPGHFSAYYPYLIHPEANTRLHFSGDALSINRVWSIGALISGYRAVKDILSTQGLNEKIKELESKWGTIDEPDFTHFHQ